MMELEDASKMQCIVLQHGFLNVHTAYYSAARVFQMEGWELRKMFKSVSTVDRVKRDIEVFSADKTVIR